MVIVKKDEVGKYLLFVLVLLLKVGMLLGGSDYCSVFRVDFILIFVEGFGSGGWFSIGERVGDACGYSRE